MSESFNPSEVEPRARWLVDLDPSRVHAWLLRAASRQHHDLLPTSPPIPPGPVHLAREAFIDWCAAGVDLFLREGAPSPSRRTIDDAAHRVMLVVVLRCHRSITAAAQALETSRRALRAKSGPLLRLIPLGPLCHSTILIAFHRPAGLRGCPIRAASAAG